MILDEIIERTKVDLEKRKKDFSLDWLGRSLASNPFPPRDVTKFLTSTKEEPIRIIAEVKKASPSKQKETKKGKKDKGEGGPKKAEITVSINEKEATKIVQNSKVITVHELARQTGVKVSAANVFLKESLKKGIIKRVGGFSGHYIYQPASS